MVDREIYELKGEVGGLKASVDTLVKTWRSQDEEANAGRRRLYDKFEELKIAVEHLASRAELDQLEDKVTTLSVKVDALDAKITAIQPQAMEWHNHQQQSIGSDKATKKVIAIVWGAILMTSGAFGGIIVKLIDIFWPPKH